jgi:hypothetical protein
VNHYFQSLPYAVADVTCRALIARARARVRRQAKRAALIILKAWPIRNGVDERNRDGGTAVWEFMGDVPASGGH